LGLGPSIFLVVVTDELHVDAQRHFAHGRAPAYWRAEQWKTGHGNLMLEDGPASFKPRGRRGTGEEAAA
jgi:hypothetical protein